MKRETNMTNDQSLRFTWRDNWFVKNVLAEIPIVGSFFKTSNLAHAFHHAGMSTSMILGATTTMMFISLTDMKESDSTGTKFAKMTIDMSTGMMGGVLTYNALYATGKKLHGYLTETNETHNLSEEGDLIERRASTELNKLS